VRLSILSGGQEWSRERERERKREEAEKAAAARLVLFPARAQKRKREKEKKKRKNSPLLLEPGGGRHLALAASTRMIIKMSRRRWRGPPREGPRRGGDAEGQRHDGEEVKQKKQAEEEEEAGCVFLWWRSRAHISFFADRLRIRTPPPIFTFFLFHTLPLPNPDSPRAAECEQVHI
jgi:hypothetical protein